jgi:hypothetical protein
MAAGVSKMRLARAGAIVLAVPGVARLALLAEGCAGGASTPGVAKIGTVSTSSSSSSSSADGTSRANPAKYSPCMRRNGQEVRSNFGPAVLSHGDGGACASSVRSTRCATQPRASSLRQAAAALPTPAARYFAGEAQVVMSTESRRAHNSKAKRELGWTRTAHGRRVTQHGRTASIPRYAGPWKQTRACCPPRAKQRT